MSRRSHRVLVLAGGASGEHSISLRSAATVVAALAQTSHETTVVGITLDGLWLLGDLTALLERAKTEFVEVPSNAGRQVTLANDGHRPRVIALDGRPLDARSAEFDVVFPVLHGPGGEDGTVQGLLELVGAAYVGAGCTASALAMDKLAMKYACAGAGVPQVDFMSAGDLPAERLAKSIDAAFGFPCFIKPANLGSSVGISKVARAAELADALAEAHRWDRRVIVERAVNAREIEVGLLGNNAPEISPPGEIVPKRGFYDFESKYCDDAAAELVAPALLDAATAERVRSIAARVWGLIGCRGLARADFFVERGTGTVLFNELNTMPGMTRISMYPRLWALAGIETGALCERLVALAIEAARDVPAGAARTRRLA